MNVYEQTLEQRNELLVRLQQDWEVYAPVKEDVVRFKKLQDPSEIHLDKNVWFPIKEFFFRKHETIFVHIGLKIQQPELKSPKRVFFGVRRCDLNAIRKQDLVFEHDANDPYYHAQRKHTILIGYHCAVAPSKYCFCGSMDLKDYQDLMYYDNEGNYLVEVTSEKGEQLIQNHQDLFTQYHRQITQDERKIEGTDRLKNHNLKVLHDNPDWKKGVELCLSCGACTTLCPTCYCHEYHDEQKLAKPDESKRVREWSSCMLQEFTRVAGDHVFRKEREDRFKHRIYHQLDYFKDKYGEFLCTGCGRCIEGCPTRIEFVDIINGMEAAK